MCRVRFVGECIYCVIDVALEIVWLLLVSIGFVRLIV